SAPSTMTTSRRRARASSGGSATRCSKPGEGGCVAFPLLPPHMVQKRCVFHIIGYEPLPPERIYRRFERGLAAFRRTWDATAVQSEPVSRGPVVSWRIDSAGTDWRVETELVLFDWSDIVLADFARPRWQIVLRGLAAVFDFLFSSAAAGYLRTNWRYL